MRRAERDGAREIIDRLRDDARPVDRIDPGEPDALAEAACRETAVSESLCASSKEPCKRDGVDIVVSDRRHLLALHVGDAAMRIEDEDVDAVQARETPRSPRRRCRRRSRRRWWRADSASPSTSFIMRPRSCIARSLKASVGPWNSSSTKRLSAICVSGAMAR